MHTGRDFSAGGIAVFYELKLVAITRGKLKNCEIFWHYILN